MTECLSLSSGLFFATNDITMRNLNQHYMRVGRFSGGIQSFGNFFFEQDISRPQQLVEVAIKVSNSRARYHTSSVTCFFRSILSGLSVVSSICISSIAFSQEGLRAEARIQLGTHWGADFESAFLS